MSGVAYGSIVGFVPDLSDVHVEAGPQA